MPEQDPGSIYFITLQGKRVNQLTEELMQVLKENSRRGPPGRERILEDLNALACTTARIIAHCNPEPEVARKFFDRALEVQFGIDQNHSN
jgi:hypothetical protein